MVKNLVRLLRKIININEELCTGCDSCITGCPEQAIQLVETPDGIKARLVKDIYCDGLGACLGTCPTGALMIEERASDPYDDDATIKRIKEVAPEVLDIHVKHLEEHANELATTHQHELDVFHHPKAHESTGCPSAQMMHWAEDEENQTENSARIKSELRQWPVQLHLVSPSAPYFQNANIAFIADCVPLCYPNFHQDFLKGKAIAICCPKLDDVQEYIPKIAQIIKLGNPKSIQVVHMTVPCCFGLGALVEEAKKQAESDLPIEEVIIGIKGEKQVVSEAG
jgi:ferredoxin